MGVAATIAEKAVEWAYKHLGAMQICWICVVATVALGWFVTTRYATAADYTELRAQVTELKGDSIAKRIFDYKVRLCDTPPEQRQEKRWLVEQIRADAEKYQKLTGQAFAVPACTDL